MLLVQAILKDKVDDGVVTLAPGISVAEAIEVLCRAAGSVRW